MIKINVTKEKGVFILIVCPGPAESAIHAEQGERTQIS